MRFSGMTEELVEAATLGPFGRFGRDDLILPLLAGLEEAFVFCCGLVGNDERRRGVPLMA
jgi:hypothetical protein